MTVEKAVDLVLNSLAIFACCAILYGILCLLPDAFDAMFMKWRMK